MPADDPADVDLRVEIAGLPELYYAQPENRAGRHLRDVRAGGGALEGDWRNLWECVELDATVPLDGVKAWLNLWRGNGSEVRGFVRVARGAEVTTKPFTLTSRVGDKGEPEVPRGESPCWSRIDLKEFLRTP